jgi:hypothetical protein
VAQQVLFTSQTFNVPDAAEGGPVTVATTFVPAVDGTVDGAQFFGEASPTGTHAAVLYEITADDTGADGSSGPGTGTELATVAIPSVNAAQWQTIAFDPVVSVTAGTAYRIGYRTSLGHYAAQGGGFNAAGIVNGDLSSPKTGDPVGDFTVIKNGTFVPSITLYPNRTFNGNMYPIGPLFTAAADIPPEDHTSTGTARATADARSTVTTTRTSTGTAVAAADATATEATSRTSAGSALAVAAAAAATVPQRISTGAARAIAAGSNYTAGGAPGPWLVSRRRQSRIVARTQVAR